MSLAIILSKLKIVLSHAAKSDRAFLKRKNSRIISLFMAASKAALIENNVDAKAEIMLHLQSWATLPWHLDSLSIFEIQSEISNLLYEGSLQPFYNIPSNSYELECAFSQLNLINPNYSSVQKFIQAQTRIRFLFNNGDGHGDQAASVNLINRIRQIGFKGIVEIIYPEEARVKIFRLMNAEDSMPDQMVFIEYNDFFQLSNSRQLPAVTLGLTGCFNEDDPNFFNFTNTVEVFVKLSPFYNKILADTQLYLQNNTIPIKQKNSNTQALIVPISTLTEAKKYLASDVDAKSIATKKPALDFLVSSIEQQTINFFPLYGFPLEKKIACLFDLILGARYAQLNGPAPLQKPLVIGLFFNYTQTFQNLEMIGNTTIGNIDISTLVGSLMGYSPIQTKPVGDNLKLKGAIRFIDISSGEWPSPLQQPFGNPIAIVGIGALPKIIFDGLFAHAAANIWPAVREGAGSYTTLLHTGRPHIHCNPVLRWNIDLTLADPVTAWQLAKLDEIVCKRIFADIKIPQFIGQYIIDAQNANSSLSRFFRRLKAHNFHTENDRIKLALTAAMHLTTIKNPNDLSPLQYLSLGVIGHDALPEVQSFKLIQPCICKTKASPIKNATLPKRLYPQTSSFLQPLSHENYSIPLFYLWQHARKRRDPKRRLSIAKQLELKQYQKDLARIEDSFVWQKNSRIARTHLIDDRIDYISRQLETLPQDIREVLTEERMTQETDQDIQNRYHRVHEIFHQIARENRNLKRQHKKWQINHARKNRRAPQNHSLPANWLPPQCDAKDTFTKSNPFIFWNKTPSFLGNDTQSTDVNHAILRLKAN